MERGAQPKVLECSLEHEKFTFSEMVSRLIASVRPTLCMCGLVSSVRMVRMDSLACIEYNAPGFLSVYGKQSSTFRRGRQSSGARNPKLHGHFLKIWFHFLGLVHSKYNLFWLLTLGALSKTT